MARRLSTRTFGIRIGPALLALVIAGAGVLAGGPAGPEVAEATPAATSSQVIAVASPTAGSSYATLTAWQRNSNGSWTAVVGPIAARVGSKGIGSAREGSRLTPAGTFALDQAFGRLANPGTRLPYFTTDRYDWWDENPASRTYNLHVRRSTSPGGASENLYNAGTAYNYAVNFAYNPTRIPGKGSAFFLHVGTGSATAGCVSIDQASLRTILRWLDPHRHPVIDIRVGSAWRPKVATTLTQTTPARIVRAGTSTALTGALVAATGQRIVGLPVQIWAASHGGHNWVHLGDARTNASGVYRYVLVPTSAKDYRVRWPGTHVWAAAASRAIMIKAVSR
jgi:L,D-peptidoglycan transpeptidase YkuD (ErfK/YbiS/YcfS/YnhG family)